MNMKKSKNVMTIRVPEELKERIERFSLLQGVSINQFALYSITKDQPNQNLINFLGMNLKAIKKNY